MMRLMYKNNTVKKIVSKTISYAVFGLIATAMPGVVNAGLLLDKVVVVFDDNKQTKKDILVINDDPDQRIFVSVEPFRVEQPGTKNESLTALLAEERPSFLASPKKLIVEPGSQSVVRLLNLEPNSTEERVYRVNYLPIEKPPELESDKSIEGIAPVVEIVVAYQVLAIILPPNPVSTPVVSRSGNTVVFRNDGNANYLLSDGRQCDPSDKSKCVDLPGHRVYAGSSWSLDLPHNGPAEYNLRTAAGSRPLVIE